MLRKIATHLKGRISSLTTIYQSRKIQTSPVSRQFGRERGQPIDRYYIEKFLNQNRSLIQGNIMEIAESTYSKKFGQEIGQLQILSVEENNPKVTVKADLTDLRSLPTGISNCFIATQTFNFIYDFDQAIQGVYKILKKDGVLLATLGGISQISRYDMDRWGDYWRFTTASAKKAFEKVFGEGNVTVDFHGNCLAAKFFLDGYASHELTKRQLDYKDQDYQLLITVVAIKK